MGAACDMYGVKEKCIQGFWWENHYETDHLELSVGRWKIPKRALNKLNGRMQTGLIWLKIGQSGGLLWQSS